MEYLKGEADFLSNLYNSNIASSFIGQIYEEIIHSKIAQGGFSIKIIHLWKDGKRRRTLPDLNFPTDFVVQGFANADVLAQLILMPKRKKTKETKQERKNLIISSH
jgi:hypothetical protein